MRFCSRLTRKGEIRADANGVHTTTTRAQMYKEVTIAQVMRTKLSHGSNFIMFGPQTGYSTSVYFFVKYIQVIQHLDTMVTAQKHAHTYPHIEKILMLTQIIIKSAPYINSQNILGIIEDQKEHFSSPGLTPSAGRRACCHPLSRSTAQLTCTLPWRPMSCGPPAFFSSLGGQFILLWTCTPCTSMLTLWVGTNPLSQDSLSIQPWFYARLSILF